MSSISSIMALNEGCSIIYRLSGSEDTAPSSSISGWCILRSPRPSVCSAKVLESQGRSGTIVFTFLTSQPSFSIKTATITLYGFSICSPLSCWASLLLFSFFYYIFSFFFLSLSFFFFFYFHIKKKKKKKKEKEKKKKI